MEYQKIINLLDTTSDNVHIFNTRKLIEVHDQSGKKNPTSTSKYDLKHQCYGENYVITVMHILLSKELLRNLRN